MGLSQFKDAHRGESIVVCGCGESVEDLADPAAYTTIGVNDIGRRFDPDYLVVVNPPSQFTGDRFRYVEASRARVLFTQLDNLRVPGATVVRFKLGSYGGVDLRDDEVLDFTQNSPYVGVCLAARMGAKRIGLIGVDFTPNHFFGKTGTHPLAHRLERIDQEYANLARACAGRGVELVNLSARSRLKSLPRMGLAQFERRPRTQALPRLVAATKRSPKVFFVNYRFLSCGEVFTDGLRRGAETLGFSHEEAYWDDPRLPAKVAGFAPDLLFVVHGRRFIRKWGTAFAAYESAVWLVDEPYEVDDTATWSHHFRTVFVNDAATLARHRNARLLPVCYDPAEHRDGSGSRPYDVGFIGGANPTREAMLAHLARQGLLSYVVGGPWRAPELKRLCLEGNIPAHRTAELYRSTKVVINIFRDTHHYNSLRVRGRALNPRIYEALACGAMVVSEPRDEILRGLPEMPTFDSAASLERCIRHLLANPEERERARHDCSARLRDDTYANRLKTVMEAISMETTNLERPAASTAAALSDPEWIDHGGISKGGCDGEVILAKPWDTGPGSEHGLASRSHFVAVDLRFEVFITTGSCFIAKIHQAGQLDQATNSYHLYCDDNGSFLARHNYVFGHVDIGRDRWESLRLTCADGVVSVFRDGSIVLRVSDTKLAGGYAFLGVKGGEARLRSIRLDHAIAGDTAPAPIPDGWLVSGRPCERRPRVSIVTTVYDRAECLRECIRSVKRLEFGDFEHIIVADAPPREDLVRLREVVSQEADARARFFCLAQRHNNWGIAPAAFGLRQAIGDFVCFLSDDNGYTPDHVGNLVQALDSDPRLGFAYSSCRYDGRLVLRHPVPMPARIDLGQPMIRRELFKLYLNDGLPFDMLAWDWYLVDALLKRGVAWRHVDYPSFIFRLSRYPELAPKP